MKLFINEKLSLDEGSTIIIGKEEDDKTQLATKLANQAKDQGAEVVYIGFPIAIEPAKYYDAETIIVNIKRIKESMMNTFEQMYKEQVNRYDKLSTKPQETLLILDEYSVILNLLKDNAAEIEDIINNFFRIGKAAGVYVILVDQPFDYGELGKNAHNKIGIGKPIEKYGEIIAEFLEISDTALEGNFRDHNRANREEGKDDIQNCGYIHFRDSENLEFFDLTEYKETKSPNAGEEQAAQMILSTYEKFEEFIDKAFAEEKQDFQFTMALYPKARAFYDEEQEVTNEKLAEALCNEENEICKQVGQAIKRIGGKL